MRPVTVVWKLRNQIKGKDNFAFWKKQDKIFQDALCESVDC